MNRRDVFKMGAVVSAATVIPVAPAAESHNNVVELKPEPICRHIRPYGPGVLQRTVTRWICHYSQLVSEIEWTRMREPLREDMWQMMERKLEDYIDSSRWRP